MLQTAMITAIALTIRIDTGMPNLYQTATAAYEAMTVGDNARPIMINHHTDNVARAA